MRNKINKTIETINEKVIEIDSGNTKNFDTNKMKNKKDKKIKHKTINWEKYPDAITPV